MSNYLVLWNAPPLYSNNGVIRIEIENIKLNAPRRVIDSFSYEIICTYQFWWIGMHWVTTNTSVEYNGAKKTLNNLVAFCIKRNQARTPFEFLF
jgi:hypothetical protein